MFRLNDPKKIKLFKRSAIIIGTITFIFIICLIMLKYEIEGENNENLPFKITEIKIASVVDAIKNEDTENIWNLNLLQMNDIYIKIDKNENKDKNIKSVVIKDIKLENDYFKNHKIIKNIQNTYDMENMESLEFVGGDVTNPTKLMISKTGGVIVFRHLIEDVYKYISNDDVVTYNMELLEKNGITREQLHTKITFNLIIELDNKVKYIANMQIDVPTSEKDIENLDVSKIIFKRLLKN